MATITGPPPPRVIKGDACSFTIGEDLYYLQRGRTVTMLRGYDVAEYKATAGLGRLGMRLEAAKGEPDEAATIRDLIDEQFDVLCLILANRVLDWDFVDIRGRPLPKPDGTVGPIEKLHSGELYWLLNAAEGETVEEEKKGSPNSTSMSSDTPRRAIRKSRNSVLSPTKD